MSAIQQAKETANSSSLRQETTSDIDPNEDQYNNGHKNKRKCKGSQSLDQDTLEDLQTTKNNEKSGNSSLPLLDSAMTSLVQQQTKSRNTLHDTPVSNMEIFLQSEQTTSLKQNKEIDITQTTNTYHSFQKTYSQAVTSSGNSRPAQHPDLIRLIKTWVSSTRQAISNSKTELFNKELWN